MCNCDCSKTHRLRAVIVIAGVDLSIVRQCLGVFQSFLLVAVILFVEVGEQEQKHDAVKPNPHHEAFWIFAISEQCLELMSEDCDELKLGWKGGDYQ